jgi:hypothetical protein
LATDLGALAARLSAVVEVSGNEKPLPDVRRLLAAGVPIDAPLGP